MPNIDIKLYTHFCELHKEFYKKYTKEQVDDKELFDMIFKVSVGAIQSVITTPKWEKWNPGFRFPEHHDPAKHNWVFKDIVPKITYKDIDREEVLDRYAKTISEVKILLLDKRFMFRRTVPKLWVYITIKVLEIISSYLVFENETKSVEQITIDCKEINERCSKEMLRLRNEMLWAAFPSLKQEEALSENNHNWSEENDQ